MKDMVIFSGNANRELANNIAIALNTSLGEAHVSRFADGEIEVKIYENVRGRDCFIIQPTSPPANENLMELLIMSDALMRASAERVTAVIPYYGYARQDRKIEPRVPISAKLIANLLTASKINRVLTVDLHVGQIQGFFDIPVDNLYTVPIFLKYLEEKNLKAEDTMIVAPDAGGVERARLFANKLNTELAIIDKRRPHPNETAIMHVIGDVKDKIAVIVDDIVDTAKTLCKAAEALKKEGAKKVYALCSHPVLSSDAVKRIEESEIEELVVTDSIPLNDKKSKKIKVVSIATLLAEAIKRIHNNESISALFK